MKLSKLMMAFAMCAVTLTGTAQTKVIAHRGYWKCEGSAQNSIASLTKAAEAKVYYFIFLPNVADTLPSNVRK